MNAFDDGVRRRARPVRALNLLAVAAPLWAALVLCDCAPRSEPAKASTAESGSAGATASGPAAVSKYDAGPRAAETPANHELAEQGEKLFQTKGCSACHAFGRRVTCPDLAGVTMRRTAAWMEQQILHPDVMTKEDPIAHQLFAQYALQMPNQGLTPEEARAVIEYFRQKNHEDGEKKE